VDRCHNLISEGIIESLRTRFTKALHLLGDGRWTKRCSGFSRQLARFLYGVPVWRGEDGQLSLESGLGRLAYGIDAGIDSLCESGAIWCIQADQALDLFTTRRIARAPSGVAGAAPRLAVSAPRISGTALVFTSATAASRVTWASGRAWAMMWLVARARFCAAATPSRVLGSP
jgi:hypothetical protein